MILPLTTPIPSPLPPAEFEKFKRSFPKEFHQQLEQRQAQLIQEKQERDRQREIKLSKVLDSETVMRFAYVPFVVANLAWDYVDTIFDMASFLRLEKTKPLKRAILELKKEYDYIRKPYQGYRTSYTENMYAFEDGVKDIVKLYMANVEIDLRCEYPNLDPDHLMLLKAVYQCHLILLSIYDYVAKQKKKIEGIVKHTIGDVLPKELRRLDGLVLAFSGDKPLSQKFAEQQKVYANNIAIKMCLIELNETK